MPAVSSPQITEVDPPLGRASESEEDKAVHEFRMAKARPSIDKREVALQLTLVAKCLKLQLIVSAMNGTHRNVSADGVCADCGERRRSYVQRDT